jgi:amino acid adenylation domain-containing protein
VTSGTALPATIAPRHTYRRGQTVPALFADAVSRRPDAVALVHGDRLLTYRELDGLAAGYADRLAAAAVVPGDYVPVIMPRTPETVAVLLAVLRRGAAYAAMDPGWPHARKAELVCQLAARLVVTDEPGWPATWHPAGDDTAGPGAPVLVTGADPCAVFFTSGSTGTPKGAVVPHFGPARLFDDCAYGDYGPGFVVPQMFPLHWDGPILDLWGPLCCGGTAVIVADVLTPALLRRLVAEHGVNASCMPTAVFNMIVDEDVDALSGFRWIVTGSEKVSPAHVGRVLARHPGIAVSNGYGPVESAGLVTTHRIGPADLADPGGIPIGRALTDSGVLVLDGDDRLCAPGERGEICLTGPGLALGYVGDPVRTDEKFATVEVHGTPIRLYRTGDLGHLTDDGLLYYGGRADWQVKIRGHRIEPGEVEHHADRVPGVLRTAVLASNGADGLATALRLWFVPDPAAPASEAGVRSALARRLPAFLVPRHITSVPTLPLTANGKVDRNALRAGIADTATETAMPIPPAGDDPVAVVTVAIGQLLGTAVEPDTDFFVAGGSSLDAARLCARVGSTLGIAVPVAQFYRTPTAAGLGRWLAQPAAAPAALPDGAGIPLTTGQANFADSPHGLVCLLCWWIDGRPDVDALAAALADLHRRHQTLHARYPRADSPIAIVPDDPGAPETHRLIDQPGAVAAAREILARPLDISAGAVWRSVLAREPGGRLLLGLGLHHIAFDGWSERIVIADLTTAYQARLAGGAPRWDRPAPTLTELATAERARRARVDVAAQRAAWRTRLRGLRGLRLPGVLPGPVPPSGPITTGRFAVPAWCLRRWDEYAKARHVGRASWMAAVFARTLADLCGQREIGLLLPVAGRGDAVLDRAVASRMDTVCVRLVVEDDTDSLLAGAGRAVAEALSGQDVPFRDVAADVVRGRLDPHAVLNLPVFLPHDHDRARLTLPGCVVELDADQMAADQAGPLAVEVLPEPDGATLRVTVRGDRAPDSLVHDVGAHYLRLLVAGPSGITSEREALG